MNILKEPWPWYIAGPLIGLIVPALLLAGNKTFGISSVFRHMCAACLPAGIKFFQYDWKSQRWNMLFVAGIVIGAAIATGVGDVSRVDVSAGTLAWLQRYGIQDSTGLLPGEIFSWQQLFSWPGLFFFAIGGFLVGFGTRYAGGCTSGHSIMGIASLQWPSLVATICFMAGGFFTVNILMPLILKMI